MVSLRWAVLLKACPCHEIPDDEEEEESRLGSTLGGSHPTSTEQFERNKAGIVEVRCVKAMNLVSCKPIHDFVKTEEEKEKTPLWMQKEHRLKCFTSTSRWEIFLSTFHTCFFLLWLVLCVQIPRKAPQNVALM
jgi:hypothetical protein